MMNGSKKFSEKFKSAFVHIRDDEESKSKL